MISLVWRSNCKVLHLRGFWQCTLSQNVVNMVNKFKFWVGLALLSGSILSSFSSCTASTTDCECKSKNTVTQFYDQEGDCSDLEDSSDMECTAM